LTSVKGRSVLTCSLVVDDNWTRFVAVSHVYKEEI
jgi:hypothetical protein